MSSPDYLVDFSMSLTHVSELDLHPIDANSAMYLRTTGLKVILRCTMSNFQAQVLSAAASATVHNQCETYLSPNPSLPSTQPDKLDPQRRVSLPEKYSIYPN
jgi:hypothetical protein